MTKFVVIIFALNITPFPHEVWSPASSANSGIELTTTILKVTSQQPLGYTPSAKLLYFGLQPCQNGNSNGPLWPCISWNTMGIQSRRRVV